MAVPDLFADYAMIRIDSIWLATEPMDIRAGTETALARVVAVFGAAKPHCAYLFANRRANLMKVLVHDGVGIWLTARSLNQGRFFGPGVRHGSEVELDAEQLQALVLGLPWQRVGSGGAITVLSLHHRLLGGCSVRLSVPRSPVGRRDVARFGGGHRANVTGGGLRRLAIFRRRPGDRRGLVGRRGLILERAAHEPNSDNKFSQAQAKANPAASNDTNAAEHRKHQPPEQCAGNGARDNPCHARQHHFGGGADHAGQHHADCQRCNAQGKLGMLVHALGHGRQQRDQGNQGDEFQQQGHGYDRSMWAGLMLGLKTVQLLMISVQILMILNGKSFRLSKYDSMTRRTNEPRRV